MRDTKQILSDLQSIWSNPIPPQIDEIVGLSSRIVYIFFVFGKSMVTRFDHPIDIYEWEKVETLLLMFQGGGEDYTN